MMRYIHLKTIVVSIKIEVGFSSVYLLPVESSSLNIILLAENYMMSAMVVVSMPSYEFSGLGSNPSLGSQCSSHPAVHSQVIRAD